MVLKPEVLYILILVLCLKTGCGFIYPGNSAYGIFAAIAVPLNLPHRNVFVSYNFEANYNLPGDAQTIIPGPYQRFTSEEVMNAAEPDVNIAEPEPEPEVVQEMGREESNSIKKLTAKVDKKSNKSNGLISRRTIYQILRGKLKASGFKGEACLLKLICEANASLLGRNNGVFGSILHILLTPSTSTYENLPTKMYKAEENGTSGDCFHYENKCPHNILDLLSAPIEDFLYKKLF